MFLVTIDNDTLSYIFSCPHCNESIMVNINEVNCAIFRHAVYKDSLEQLSPHASKEVCDHLYKNNKVFGCAKPFQLIKNDQGVVTHVDVCDYV